MPKIGFSRHLDILSKILLCTYLRNKTTLLGFCKSPSIFIFISYEHNGLQFFGCLAFEYQ